jgi:galactoside O-acetyltransferase
MNNPLDPGYYGSEELRSFGFKAVGENVLISRLAHVHGEGRVEIGDNVRIDAFTTIVAASGHLKIGSNVHICTGCMIGARGGVDIGDHVVFSHGSKAISASDDFSGNHMTGPHVPDWATNVTAAPIRIGRHAAIGAGVLIMPGTTIGEGAAIGCKSLVNRDVPAWEIHLGTPARKTKDRSRRALALEGMVGVVPLPLSA